MHNDEVTSQDVHHWREASGLYGLQMFGESLESLNRISPHNEFHPDVMQLRSQVCLGLKNYGEAFFCAKKLAEARPDEPMGPILLAEALRHNGEDGLRRARNILLGAYHRFGSDSLTIPYNISAYSAALGDRRMARKFLLRTFIQAAGTEWEGYYENFTLTDADFAGFNLIPRLAEQARRITARLKRRASGGKSKNEERVFL